MEPIVAAKSMPCDPNPIHLDLRGLKCPLPVLRTRKLLRKLDEGGLVIVECTDPLAPIDIPHLVRTTGDSLEFSEERDGVHVFHIRKARVAASAP
jgi:tRNA 2-thiouridine synthesizing protein A